MLDPPSTFWPVAFLGIDRWKFKLFFFLGGGDVGWQGFPRIPQGSPRESPVSVQSAGGGGGGGKNVTYYVGTWQLTFYRYLWKGNISPRHMVAYILQGTPQNVTFHPRENRDDLPDLYLFQPCAILCIYIYIYIAVFLHWRLKNVSLHFLRLWEKM